MERDLCGLHYQQNQKIDYVGEKIDEIKETMIKIAEYIPKIEVTLSKLLDIQRALEATAETHKLIFTKIEEVNRKIFEQDLKLQELETFKDAVTEATKTKTKFIMGIAGGVIVGVVLAAIGFGMVMYASHAPVKLSDDTQKAQTK